jgi:hypothetical protein
MAEQRRARSAKAQKLSPDRLTHEERLSYVERDLQHTSDTLDRLSETVTTGFEEIRRTFRETETRAQTRDDRLHTMMTDATQVVLTRGQVSWPLLIMLGAFVVSLISVGVTFVNMRMTPHETNAKELAEAGLRHDAQDGHTGSLVRHGEVTEKFKSLDIEDEQIRTAMHKEDGHIWRAVLELNARQTTISEDSRANAIANAKAQTATEFLRKGMEDRFFGSDGTRLESRITDLEAFIREHHAAPAGNDK